MMWRVLRILSPACHTRTQSHPIGLGRHSNQLMTILFSLTWVSIHHLSIYLIRTDRFSYGYFAKERTLVDLGGPDWPTTRQEMTTWLLNPGKRTKSYAEYAYWCDIVFLPCILFNAATNMVTNTQESRDINSSRTGCESRLFYTLNKSNNSIVLKLLDSLSNLNIFIFCVILGFLQTASIQQWFSPKTYPPELQITPISWIQ